MMTTIAMTGNNVDGCHDNDDNDVLAFNDYVFGARMKMMMLEMHLSGCKEEEESGKEMKVSGRKRRSPGKRRRSPGRRLAQWGPHLQHEKHLATRD